MTASTGEQPDRAAAPRVRRPLDAAWMVAALVGVVVVMLVAGVTSQTLTGVGEDLAGLGDAVPVVLIGPVSLVTSIIALLAAPGVFAVLLVRGRARIAALTLAAGAVAVVLAVAAGAAVRALGDHQLQLAFTPSPGGIPDTWPFLAFVVAVMALPRFSERSQTARVVRWSIALLVVVSVLQGTTTVAGVLVSLLVAVAAVSGTLFVAGVQGVPLDEARVAETLHAGGVTCGRVTSDPAATERVGITEAQTGFRVDDQLDVVVLTRDRIGVGLVYRAWRRLRIRGAVQPPLRFSLRRSVDREALLAHAVAAAGVRTPRLVAALPVRGSREGEGGLSQPDPDGPDAVALVVEHVESRPFFRLAADEVTDEVLEDVWRQVGALRRAGIAHRRLTGRALRLDGDGRVWIVGAGAGEIAADPVALTLDVTQALVEVALVAGVDRTVDSALDGLGPEVVAEAAGLLQPVLLTRETRSGLRGRRDLLPSLRTAVGATVEVPSTPPRLEKLSLRTIVTGVAVAVALYLVASQLTGVDVVAVVRDARPAWVLAALVAMATTYVGAGYAVVGFVPEKLPVLRTIAVQLGLGFVRLVAPPAVGAVAVNVRYLVRSGVSAAGAAASMAASQLAAFVIGIVLIPVLGTITGRSVTRSAPGTTVVVAVLAVLAVAIAVVAVWSRLRNRVLASARRFVNVALPRLSEVAQQPWKLVQGIGGTLLITAGYVACLDLSARAFGVDVPVTLIAVVFLTGNTVGSALPTPGGLGAVEAVLTAGLTAVGVPAATAVTTVLLFRLVSFWLPLLPGWVTWTILQRRRIV